MMKVLDERCPTCGYNYRAKTVKDLQGWYIALHCGGGDDCMENEYHRVSEYYLSKESTEKALTDGMF